MPIYWVNPSRPTMKRMTSAARRVFASRVARKVAKKFQRAKVRAGLAKKFMSLSEFEARASKKRPPRRKPKRTSNPKKRGKKMAKLFGAALKARRKRLAKLKRRRGRVRVSNPRRRRRRKNPGGRGGTFKVGKKTYSISAAKIAARAARIEASRSLKKRKTGKGIALDAARFRKRLSKAQRRVIWNQYTPAQKRAMRKAMRKVGKKRRRSTAKSTTKKTTKRKDPKRVRAAKKAARTRKRNLKAKQAARSAKKGKSMAKKGKRGRVRRRRFPRGAYSPYLLKARRSIKRGRSRKYGTKRSRRTIRAFGMRVRNPVGAIMAAVKGAVKAALPVVGGYVGTRLVINKVGGLVMSKLPIPARFQGPLMSVLGVVAAHYATSKIKPLQKYRSGVMVGAGINLIQTLFAEFAPASVKGFLGVGDVYQEALADYVETGDYLETGDYVETGIEQDLAGMEQDLAGPMVGPVPSHPLLGPVSRGHGAVGPVRDFTPADMDGLYTGNFAKKSGW